MTASSHLSSLPDELLIMILLQLNITDLSSLSQAAASYHDLVHKQLPAIFPHILEKSTHPAMQKLVRLAVLLLSDIVPGESLTDFRDQFFGNKTGVEYFIVNDASSKIWQKVLDIYGCIETLTTLCLDTLIEKCMTMQPQELVDKSFSYHISCAFADNSVGKAYLPVNIGAPSEVERLRVSLALWRVEVFTILRTAVRSKRCHCWSPEDISTFLYTDITAFYTSYEGLGLGECELEQFSIVQTWLVSQFPDRCNKGETLHTHTPQQATLMHQSEALTTLPLPVIHSPIIGTDFILPSPPANVPDAQKSWETSAEGISRSSPGYRIIRMHLQRDWKSPIQFVPLSFFRKYALVMWDRRRLYGLGLDVEPWEMGRKWMLRGETRSDLVFRWRSLLNKEQLEWLEAKRARALP